MGHFYRSRLFVLRLIVCACLFPTAASAGRDCLWPARLATDLDSDGKNDVTKSVVHGSSLKIRIQLPGLGEGISLFANVDGEFGLRLLAFDINHDLKTDLILTSATSFRPVAVWLNQGKGHFEKNTHWLSPLLIQNDSPAIGRPFQIASEDPIVTADAGIYPREVEAYEPAPPRIHFTTRDNDDLIMIPTRWKAPTRGPPLV